MTTPKAPTLIRNQAWEERRFARRHVCWILQLPVITLEDQPCPKCWEMGELIEVRRGNAPGR